MLDIVGDSHVIGLERFAKGRDDVLVKYLAPGLVLLKNLIEDDQISPLYREKFESGRRAVLSYGNDIYGTICVRLDASRLDFVEFDICTPARPDPAENLILSENLICDFLKFQFGNMIRLSKLTPVHAIVSGPPPTRSDDVIRSAYARRNITDIWIAPAEIRLELWRMQRTIQKQCAEDMATEFIDIPENTQDNDGFLRPEYVHDGTHGNTAYCKLVFDKITSRFLA